jgi:hypothetical protein
MMGGAMRAGELRRIAYERQEGRCAVTGAPLGDLDGGWHLHHRRPGGRGGTSRGNQQEPSNVLALLARVHNFGAAGLLLDGVPGRSVHGSPAWSRPLGLLVSSNVDEPGSIPVRLAGIGWAFLLDDGRVLPIR